MSIQFSSYNRGIITFDASVLESAMQTETLDSFQYDYIDPNTGISFQKISKTYLFIADPSYPLTKAILDDEYQIIYDPTYTGFQQIKFVGKGLNPFSPANAKDINDILEIQKYNYKGILPITSFQQLYMKIHQLEAKSNYIVGTLFTPSQPYLKVSYMYNESIQNTIPANITFARIKYDHVVESIGNEEKDDGQITLINSGNDCGIILLPISGRYQIHASFGLVEATTAPFETSAYFINYKINGVIKEAAICPVNYLTAPEGVPVFPLINAGTVGTAQISSIVLIKDSDLTGENNTAKLEIFGAHNCANPRSVSFGAQNSYPDDNWNPYTMCSVTFLG